MASKLVGYEIDVFRELNEYEEDEEDAHSVSDGPDRPTGGPGGGVGAGDRAAFVAGDVRYRFVIDNATITA